jgi:hypothetical protein
MTKNQNILISKNTRTQQNRPNTDFEYFDALNDSFQKYHIANKIKLNSN